MRVVWVGVTGSPLDVVFTGVPEVSFCVTVSLLVTSVEAVGKENNVTVNTCTCFFTQILHFLRALCRINLLPVTYVLVDTWMLTVKLVYELSDVPDDLKWATNTHMTPFYTHFQA